MAEVTVKQLHEIMGKPENIRNWTLIGTADHGVDTISDVLDERAGVRLSVRKVPQKNAKKDEEELERRSSSIMLFHAEILPEPEPPEEEEKGRGRGSPFKKEEEVPEVPPEEYVLNLIDSRGHAEFSTDIASSLRVSDGALIVVDCIQGMAFETETGLRQAIAERIKPCMAINQLDQGFLELQLDWEMFYSNFSRQIEFVNKILDTYRDPAMGDVQLHPAQGSVAFTAGTNKHTLTHAHTHTHAHAYTHTHVHTHTYTYTHPHTQTNTNTHTNTHRSPHSLTLQAHTSGASRYLSSRDFTAENSKSPKRKCANAFG
jgi:elongation factor 2